MPKNYTTSTTSRSKPIQDKAQPRYTYNHSTHTNQQHLIANLNILKILQRIEEIVTLTCSAHGHALRGGERERWAFRRSGASAGVGSRPPELGARRSGASAAAGDREGRSDRGSREGDGGYPPAMQLRRREPRRGVAQQGTGGGGGEP